MLERVDKSSKTIQLCSYQLLRSFQAASIITYGNIILTSHRSIFIHCKVGLDSNFLTGYNTSIPSGFGTYFEIRFRLYLARIALASFM